MKVRRKKSVVADRRSQHERLRMKNLRTLLAIHSFLKFPVELTNWDPDQFQGRLVVGFEDGLVSAPAAKRAAQPPMLVRSPVSLQRADVGESFQ